MKKASLEKLIQANISDTTVLEQIQKKLIEKARTMALLLGSALIIVLIAIVYAFIQQVKFEHVQIEISDLKKELDQSKTEYEKQVALATEAKIIAEEVARLSYEQLLECRSNK